MKGADVFLGVSEKDCVTEEMLLSMNKNPVVFAMANPDPEIGYETAVKTRKDLIMATGRSDYPNQVNNVLGFPFIFRGALDVRAHSITEGMKLAAAESLALLAKEPVPDSVSRAYGGIKFAFGPEYIVPKPFDPRVIEWEAVAVAKAACAEGVAAKALTDWEAYREGLRNRMKKYWKEEA
jgi:malate dehydrogenase (oxaloacetate-decarboxylating)(NADP+)